MINFKTVVKLYTLILLLTLSSIEKVVAQSNFHKETIAYKDTINLSSKGFVLAETIEIANPNGQIFEVGKHFSFSEGKIIMRAEATDSLQISYRTFSPLALKNYQLLDPALISKTPLDQIPLNQAKELRLIKEENIDYSGSISRGISIGNKQDLVLNSALDLQMAGTFGQGLELEAAFSDQNIPLQPEGNTQQIRDFDKVYIKLAKNAHELRAGDYEILSDASYFTKYFKKLQGISYSNQTTFEDKLQLDNALSLAILKGKYARNNIQAIEGNQGPYKLNGNDKENFIFIIAATEKVFIDGVQMKRGIEEDYTIDYNRAEITFTAKRLITKDKRIIIDFEYSNQDFVRSAYAYSGKFEGEKFKSWIEIYAEQDNKNSSGLNRLDAEQKQFLASLGDDINQETYSGVSTNNEELENTITYTYIDTIVDGISYDSILVFENNSSKNLYNARFSEVGNNNGNYIKDDGFTNGLLFKWVAPINGNMQGDYEPIIKLNPPKLNRMVSAGTTIEITNQLSATSEISWTTNDKNRYATLGNDDNQGLGIMSSLILNKPIINEKTTFKAGLKYEYISEEFSFINPYRAPEFIRDWNVDSALNSAEQLGLITVGLAVSDVFKIDYDFNNFIRKDIYEGTKHRLYSLWKKSGYHFELNTSFLDTKAGSKTSTFLRPKIHFYKTLNEATEWKIGTIIFQEKNKITFSLDSLDASSFQFEDYSFYFENSPESPIHNHFLINRRVDYSPSNQDLKKANSAWQITYKGHWKKHKHSKLYWTFNYRDLKVKDFFTTLLPKETYLGRIEYNFHLAKGFLQSISTYEIGSGQEAKTRFNFIEVEPGQGSFQWNDYNQDSIQQVNEFEIAVNRDQATFVRFNFPTNEYVQTNNILFNQSLNLNPKILWNKNAGLKKQLAKFSTQSNIKILRKTNDQSTLWNPFDFQLEDQFLINSSVLLSNNLFFQRSSRTFNAYLGHSIIQNKINLDVGSQSNETNSQFLHYELRLNELINQLTDFKIGRENSRNSFFELKNFDLRFAEISPKLKFLVNKSIKAEISYNLLHIENVFVNSGEVMKSNKGVFSFQYQKKTDFSIAAEFTYAAVNFEGNQDSPVAFQMLDGLRRGENFLWTLLLNHRIAKNLILSLSYEGRKTGLLNVVHLGNIQVKASF